MKSYIKIAKITEVRVEIVEFDPEGWDTYIRFYNNEEEEKDWFPLGNWKPLVKSPYEKSHDEREMEEVYQEYKKREEKNVKTNE